MSSIRNYYGSPTDEINQLGLSTLLTSSQRPKVDKEIMRATHQNRKENIKKSTKISLTY